MPTTQLTRLTVREKGADTMFRQPIIQCLLGKQKEAMQFSWTYISRKQFDKYRTDVRIGLKYAEIRRGGEERKSARQLENSEKYAGRKAMLTAVKSALRV